MTTLFVLLPPGAAAADLFAGAGLAERHAGLQLRTYPPASDGSHLLSLVRAGRDRVATRWRRGALWAVGAGAVLGLLTNGVLACAFAMFGGLLEIALPLGLFAGAFLGGFTAAMAGTEVARDELRVLAREVRPGAVLLQVGGGSPAAIGALHDFARRCGWPAIRC